MKSAMSDLYLAGYSVGMSGGGIRYSLDYGVTFASGVGVPGAVVDDIRFDPIDPNRAYAVRT